MNETFDVHITFTSGDRHKEPNKSMEEVISAIHRLTRGPAAAAGLIDEVKVVDLNDMIVFHSEKGRILFPKR